jgi:hypothetical protein
MAGHELNPLTAMLGPAARGAHSMSILVRPHEDSQWPVP